MVRSKVCSKTYIGLMGLIGNETRYKSTDLFPVWVLYRGIKTACEEKV